MSLDATLWAWKQKGLTPAEKNVLLSLADRAGEEHTAWPSAKRLARDTELSDRHVRRVLKELVGKGKIRRHGEHSSGVVIYQLINVRGRENNDLSPPDIMSGGPDTASGGADTMSPKPSIEPSSKSNTPLIPPIAITQTCYEEAQRRFTGYDIEAMERTWKEWQGGKKEPPNNPDSAFLGWARKYIQNHPLPYGGGF